MHSSDKISSKMEKVDSDCCPLCSEPYELDDLHFFPCKCFFKVCRFCWHRIRTNENGLCPGCRRQYPENPTHFRPLSAEEMQEIKNQKKLKLQQKRQQVNERKKQLENVRIIQKNLVFIVGLPIRFTTEDDLAKVLNFKQFGKTLKVIVNNHTRYAGVLGPCSCAYITYQRSEDALRAIQTLTNTKVEGRSIRASLGTTKYCSFFLKSQHCPKPDCMYVHEMADEEVMFTKEDIQAGKHFEYEQKLIEQLNTPANRSQSQSSDGILSNSARRSIDEDLNQESLCNGSVSSLDSPGSSCSSSHRNGISLEEFEQPSIHLEQPSLLHKDDTEPNHENAVGTSNYSYFNSGHVIQIGQGSHNHIPETTEAQNKHSPRNFPWPDSLNRGDGCEPDRNPHRNVHNTDAGCQTMVNGEFRNEAFQNTTRQTSSFIEKIFSGGGAMDSANVPGMLPDSGVQRVPNVYPARFLSSLSQNCDLSPRIRNSAPHENQDDDLGFDPCQLSLNGLQDLMMSEAQQVRNVKYPAGHQNPVPESKPPNLQQFSQYGNPAGLKHLVQTPPPGYKVPNHPLQFPARVPDSGSIIQRLLQVRNGGNEMTLPRVNVPMQGFPNSFSPENRLRNPREWFNGAAMSPRQNFSPNIGFPSPNRPSSPSWSTNSQSWRPSNVFYNQSIENRASIPLRMQHQQRLNDMRSLQPSASNPRFNLPYSDF